MLCAEDELGLGEDHDGIVVLPAEARTGQTAQQALGLDDTVLDISITPNRGDCMSHLGIAREVAALFGVPYRLPGADLGSQTGGDSVAGVASVRVMDPQGCSRYTARLIRGVTVKPSPGWMQQRLRAVGVRPISNLVDITNYVMFELGQPLHAFDLARLAGPAIVVRRAHKGERMHTLDEIERALEPSDLLVCDAEAPVALAGVMGGLGSAISDTTTDVLLESAYFDPRSVRVTARRLNLHSESSHRFERGIDPTGVELASARAASLMAEHGGGKVTPGVIDEYPAPPRTSFVTFRPGRVRSVLGVATDDPEIRKHLEGLGMKVDASKEASWRVACPSHRHDLAREIDLVEEVARMVGYDQVPATLPPTSKALTAPIRRLDEMARDALAEAGLRETINFAFTGRGKLTALRFEGGHPVTRPVTLRNPMTEDQAVLRTSLVPGLLAQLGRNQAHGAADVRLFEVGHAFFPAAGQSLPREPLFAAGVMTGERAGWLKPEGPLQFSDAKGIVEHLLFRLGAGEAHFVAARDEHAFLHPGVAASIRLGDAPIGAVGEVHPDTAGAFDVRTRALAFELHLDALGVPPPRQLQAIPRYPSVVRDISFWVEDTEPAAKVERIIRSQAPDTLESVRVVDDYREAGRVPQGKKGMLWSLTYRSAEKTLTDAEVDATHEDVVAALLAELGATRR